MENKRCLRKPRKADKLKPDESMQTIYYEKKNTTILPLN